MGDHVLTVTTDGDEVIASLEDAGYTVIPPDAAPPPIEDDAAYWRKMYEERMVLEEDGFAALLADRDRYREALETCRHALKSPHHSLGEACGVDACALCWAEQTVLAALDVRPGGASAPAPSVADREAET